MFLRSLKLNRLLSFGPDAEAVELRPLNVLIGPNGSGKSNFIEAISLLRAAPKELVVPVRIGGGVGAWIWRGAPGGQAELEAVLSYQPENALNLRHRIAFTEVNSRLDLVDERIENELNRDGASKPSFYFGYENGRPMLNAKEGPRMLRREDVDPEKSILAQRKDPDVYPELSFLSEAYEGIRLYREWTFGRFAPPRQPQRADLPAGYLLEDASNLGLVLNWYRNDVPTKRALIEHLRTVFDGVVDFSVQVLGGMVQIFLEEERWTIPASRLSDGTMRWLSLLAILLDPKPPPLVCIEEPELGLHPDLMNPLARLLKDASERMQLVVTTHSEALVDAFRHTPEDILVCERRDGSTTMQRLDPEQLSKWLEEYSLGQLWSKGVLGGNRW
ncbi:AAA family ATPase [Polyangium sp. 15x6]|uniref:AAA family ATPase n=1 Tax=Polyangium sp. 15x6 TaxID=3042687 RepID=UPI002499CD84|nr:AAA family ATPase [Polyangium sp. 15x6]MDI3285345.1 AAA family ATPase [Polyangium sp. 15x6]